MNFDANQFNGSNLETVKTVRGVFYKKDAVDALLQQLSAQAELMAKDNELLGIKLSNAEKDLAERGNAEDTARELAQNIIADANTIAETITSDAKEEADKTVAAARIEAQKLLDGAEEKKDAAIRETLHRKDTFIAELNRAWQTFLSGAPDDVPADLSEKVGAIAREIDLIEDDDED